MEKPVIRSITVFTEKINYWNKSSLKNITEEAVKISEDIKEILVDNKYSIWTTRITFPQPPVEIYDNLPDIVSDILPEHYLVNIGGLYIEKIGINVLKELISQNVFTGLLWFNEFQLDKITRIFYELSQEEPEYNTRIALSLTGKPLETPYYPLSTSINGLGVGIAFLYPKILIKAYKVEGLNSIYKTIYNTHSEVSMLLSNKYRLVIDHSISPWRDNSVALLLETITGESINEPGFIEGIYLLNKVLLEVKKLEYSGGFNEVMLPYAEDQLLMNAGRNGVIRARDLLLYSSICVAGPDMIVVPLDYKKLRSFIKASYILSLSLNKQLALRVIGIDAEPGEEVMLERFGWVSVIDY